MDLYRITHPLRLARGSHQPGSGKGCAMNVISYITGDEQVTDFPTRSARPLSLLVQTSNDLLAGPAGYLYPMTACWPSTSPGRRSEPPMFLRPSSTPGSPNC
jgi:hypothetical protein